MPHKLTARRKSRGLTQAGLAQRIPVVRTTVQRWEYGTSTPEPWHREPLATALEVSLDTLEELLELDEPIPSPATQAVIASEWTPRAARNLVDAINSGEQHPVSAAEAPRLVHEWLVSEPPQSVELTRGRRIGSRLVDQVVSRIDQLRHLDDVIAGDDLTQVLDRELAATTKLVRKASYTDETGQRLLAAFGDLCQLAGWAAVDAGRNPLAVHFYATGIAAAHAARDRPLAGQLITTLAYHLANVGHARDAVLLAQTAAAGCNGHTTATTMALILERLAWAHARARDRRQTERTLGQVNDVYADRNPDDDPSWVYWLTQDEVEVMAGRCWVELSQPDRALALLDRAVAGYGDERPREAGLYLSWLAEAHHQAGEVERDAQLGCRVLELTSHTASTRSDERARHLQRLLRPHRGLNAVADFEDLYRTTMHLTP